MIREVQLHHVLTERVEAWALSADLHALRNRRRTRSREAAPAVHLDEAQTARADGLQRVGRAEFGNLVADRGGGADERSALGNGDSNAIDLQRDQLVGWA